ncbi:MAG: NAD(P)-binding protein [Woeseia sp.]
MSSKLRISRRDFMNGMAMSLAAGTSLSPLELMAMKNQGVPEGPYPPALTGMRGSHPGSFEVAHAVAWDGAKYPRPSEETDDTYELVVVGGGISGLSAALFYRQRVGPDARILIIDNHDDFGGHAKRNEFNVDGKDLICYGGSETIDQPARYSPPASQLLKDVGIVTDRFYEYYDQKFFENRGLSSGIWFSEEAYGADVLARNVFRDFPRTPDRATVEAVTKSYPISAESKNALADLLLNEKDYLADYGITEKVDMLGKISYFDFLVQHTGVTREVAEMYNDTMLSLWGVGGDAFSALNAYYYGYLGTQALDMGHEEGDFEEDGEPYIFHFPDGNAGVARSIVRQLIPEAVPGSTMEDLVTARVDYSALDQKTSNIRIRLNSTGVDVRHTPDQKRVDVIYVHGGNPYRVRGQHVVLACYNRIIPHICPEVPESQAQAINYATKTPLVYINIAVRNWRALAELGFHRFYVPKSDLMVIFRMDFPVSMGDYKYTQNPDEPTVLHGKFVPAKPYQGLSAREQNVVGRRRLYEMSFDDFENGILRQLDGALSGGGFDVESDIAAITVNRWPHGYAYEYIGLSEPPEWSPENGPHIEGRAQIGRISIANSDASAYAYVNGAIDAADRAVKEQIG